MFCLINVNATYFPLLLITCHLTGISLDVFETQCCDDGSFSVRRIVLQIAAWNFKIGIKDAWNSKPPETKYLLVSIPKRLIEKIGTSGIRAS